MLEEKQINVTFIFNYVSLCYYCSSVDCDIKKFYPKNCNSQEPKIFNDNFSKKCVCHRIQNNFQQKTKHTLWWDLLVL